MTPTRLISVVDPSEVGEARRRAVAVAAELGFSETETGKVALVATELATNLVRHGGGGELLLRQVQRDARIGLELLALDRGPGIANVARSLQDGFSTAGTPGNGLGAIRRLSTEFDIHSLPGAGTAVLARLWLRPPGPDCSDGARRMLVGAVCLPKPGEEVCGDAWDTSETADRFRLLVVDGLGHGPHAADAANEALRVFAAHAPGGPTAVIEAAHLALVKTRGAAMAMAEVHAAAAHVDFAGVGNVGAAICAPGERAHNLVSLSGTVGHQMRRVQEFDYPFPPSATLVMHTDGLGSQWKLERYPGLTARDPSIVAGVLYRDFRRATDDVTVVVTRMGEGAR